MTEGYDTFRQRYDDVIDGEKREKHFCPMYLDHIPFDISYENAKCEFYEPRR